MSNKETSLLIINFLKTAVRDNQVAEEYIDSIDVAIDCLADAFSVSRDDDASVLSSYQGNNLVQILDAFKSGKSASAAAPATEAQEVPIHVDVDEETQKKADALKLEGNKAIASRDFETAVAKYTEALALVPHSAVYLSNRAAAYSSLRKHEEAIKDANAAIEINPKYSKAYSRLGLAYFALNKPKDSLDAYKKGLESEGDKPSDAMKKGYETAKKRVEEQLGLSATESTREVPSSSSSAGASAGAGASGFPDFSNLASMLGGGAGGAPNFAEMLNNPQLMEYANSLMSNPDALNNIMSNPAIQQMAQQFGAGGSGGTPDLASMMNNPALQDLANGFLGGNRNNGGAGGNNAGNQ